MNQWVIFGCGNYLNDLFDIIHANHDQVKAIIINLELSTEAFNDLERRIALVNYPIRVISFADFMPEQNEKYTFGFANNRHRYITQAKNVFDLNFSSLIHPFSDIGSNVHLGEGVRIGSNTVIAPNATIGDFCIINRAVSIGHDTIIEKFCTLAPGVDIGGLTIIQNYTNIGIGATIIDRVNIGSNTTIGAGSVVVNDMPANVVAFGVPAKVIRENLLAD